MHLIDAANAADYLRSTGRFAHDETLEVTELAGGVSNVVLLVTRRDGERFVLKQSRDKLRVKEVWLCPPDRIWREMETLQACEHLLDNPHHSAAPIAASVPNILWEDRQNFLFAMSAAPAEHHTWKQRLFSGIAPDDLQITTACGCLLATLHGRSWNDKSLARQLGDQIYFDQLRLDPYYRHVARQHPDVAPAVQKLLDHARECRLAIVHGDFSPKNLLCWPGHVLLIDFEVGHFGDPAFDLGFFLTHLVLKSIWAGENAAEYRHLAATFWDTYQKAMVPHTTPSERQQLEHRAVLNLAGCMLARIDGKSPVDYLSHDQQDCVRAMSKSWLLTPPPTLDAVLSALD